MATDLKGELTCPICMELYSQPLRLPCGHSYCRHCLATFVGQQSTKDIVTGQMKPVKCPECRHLLEITHSGLDAFPPDFKLTNLVDVFRKMEDEQNRNQNEEYKPSSDYTIQETDKECFGACGYSPVADDPSPLPPPLENPEDVCCGRGEDNAASQKTRRMDLEEDIESDTDSEKELSDDSMVDVRPRRRKRRNKVIRFFASLLSLSSSDGEYNLGDASSSSSDIDTSRPVREEHVSPSPVKETPRRRNRWGFFMSSSSSDSEQEHGAAGGAGDDHRPTRRKPTKKSAGVMSSIEKRLRPSSEEDQNK